MTHSIKVGGWFLIVSLATMAVLLGCEQPAQVSADAQAAGDGDAMMRKTHDAAAPMVHGPSIQTVSDVTLDGAHKVLMAAMKKADELGTQMDIAVVDRGGNLKAFVRMDGAWRGSIDIAIRKARTSRMFDMNTGDIGQLSQPGGSLWQIEASNGGLITFPGGVPLKDSAGNVVGAVGVSGSTVENDHAVASAGAAALK